MPTVVRRRRDSLPRMDEATFQSKREELQKEAREVERGLDEAGNYDPQAAERGLLVYDFSQKLVDIWLGSNFSARREILDCVSLNRELTPQGLVLSKRSPFDLLAERASCHFGRGEWPSFEPLPPAANEYRAMTIRETPAHLSAAERLVVDFERAVKESASDLAAS